MAVVFYDVKNRKKVKVDEKELKKTKYQRKLKDGRIQVRYAFRAKTADGRPLTKFVAKSDWDQIKAPME